MMLVVFFGSAAARQMAKPNPIGELLVFIVTFIIFLSIILLMNKRKKGKVLTEKQRKSQGTIFIVFGGIYGLFFIVLGRQHFPLPPPFNLDEVSTLLWALLGIILLIRGIRMLTKKGT